MNANRSRNWTLRGMAALVAFLSPTPCFAEEPGPWSRAGAGSPYGWVATIGPVASLMNVSHNVRLADGHRQHIGEDSGLKPTFGSGAEFAVGARLSRRFALLGQAHLSVTAVPIVFVVDFQLVGAWLPKGPWSLEAGVG